MGKMVKTNCVGMSAYNIPVQAIPGNALQQTEDAVHESVLKALVSPFL